jgi:hypothetical protein
MGKSFHVCQVVDRYNLKTRVAESCAEHVPSDAAKSVDAYFYCHG